MADLKKFRTKILKNRKMQRTTVKKVTGNAFNLIAGPGIIPKR